MDSGDSLFFIVLAILLSAFFSGMEIAFVSANRLKIELDKKQGTLSGKINSFFAARPSSFIGTMVIGNNIVLVLYGILFAQLLHNPLTELSFHVLGYESEGSVTISQTIISTLLILVTGEYLPKNIFRLNPNRMLNLFAVPAFILYWVFYPFGFVAASLSEGLLKLLPGYGKDEKTPTFGRMDLDNLLREATESSQENESEIDHELIILQNALEFEHTKVRDCIVHRTEIEAVEVGASVDELRQKFVETGLSKIMVFEEDIDHIIGYVHLYALFKNPSDIRSVMITPLIIPESMPVKEVLSQFISKRKSMALVVDEFGGTAGILTIEDVMEEIFGEIEDEHDSEELTEQELPDGGYLFSGRHEIRYLNEKYKLGIPEHEDYSTLAGFIMFEHKSLPEEQETVHLEAFEVQIIQRNGGKIEVVKIWPKAE
jgi:CBS domain containing-hemolysin-like protein